jgi:hypothetical protein
MCTTFFTLPTAFYVLKPQRVGNELYLRLHGKEVLILLHPTGTASLNVTI